MQFFLLTLSLGILVSRNIFPFKINHKIYLTKHSLKFKYWNYQTETKIKGSCLDEYVESKYNITTNRYNTCLNSHFQVVDIDKDPREALLKIGIVHTGGPISGACFPYPNWPIDLFCPPYTLLRWVRKARTVLPVPKLVCIIFFI